MTNDARESLISFLRSRARRNPAQLSEIQRAPYSLNYGKAAPTDDERRKRFWVAYCLGGDSTCETCVGSCGIEEYLERQPNEDG